MERLLARALEDGLIRDAAVAQTEAQAKALLGHPREPVRRPRSPRAPPGSTTSRCRSRQVADFIDRGRRAAMQAFAPGVRIAAFGHVGDGNIHYDVLRPRRRRPGRRTPPRRDEGSRIVHDIVAVAWAARSAPSTAWAR